FRKLAGGAELAKDLSLQVQLVNGGILHSVRISGVRDVEHLLRPARDADGRWCPNVGELRLETTVAIEHLDALVALVGHIDHTLAVDCNAVDDVELSLPTSARTPVPDPLAVFVVLRHARVAIAVGDIDVACPIPRDVGRTREAFAGRSCAGKRWSGTSAAFTISTAATAPAARLGNRLDDGNYWKRIEPRSGNVYRFGLPAEDHLHAAVRIELDDLCRHLIDDAHIVLRID